MLAIVWKEEGGDFPVRHHCVGNVHFLSEGGMNEDGSSFTRYKDFRPCNGECGRAMPVQLPARVAEAIDWHIEQASRGDENYHISDIVVDDE